MGAKKAFSYIKRQMKEVNPIGRQRIELTPLWLELCCSQNKRDHVEYHATLIGARGSGRSNAKAACRNRALDEDYGESAFCNIMTKLNSPNKLLSPIYSQQDTPK